MIPVKVVFTAPVVPGPVSNVRYEDEKYALKAGEHTYAHSMAPVLEFGKCYRTTDGTDIVEDAAWEAAITAAAAQKTTDIADALPSWAQIAGACDQLATDIDALAIPAAAKDVLKRMVSMMRKHIRASYWDIKNTAA